MNRTFWRQVWEILSWPKEARESVHIRLVAMAQVFLLLFGTKTAIESGGWWWGLPIASIVLYPLTYFVIGAFLFINLMNPFKRD